MDFLPELNPTDEAEFAGYVDSGIWEMELWLDQIGRLQTHHRLSQDDTED